MSEWPLVRLGLVAQQVREVVRVSPEGTYRLLGVRWYGEGPFHRETVTSATSKATRLFAVQARQFIYNRLFAGRGSFGMVSADLAGTYVSNEFPLFACDESRLMPEYLRLWFQQASVWDEIEQVSTGTTQSRSRWNEDRFLDYCIPLPPIQQQRRIVDLVGAVDLQIAALQAEAVSLESLLGCWRRELPDSREVPLGEMLSSIDSGKSVLTAGEEPHADAPRILKLSAIGPGVFDPGQAKALADGDLVPASARVNEGDLLMTRSNTPERVGFCARARGVPADTYMPDLIWRLVVDEGVCHPDYLEQVLASPPIRDRIRSTASGTSASMQKINKRGVAAVRIPLPDFAVQSTYAETSLSMAELSANLLAEIAALRSFRAALLSDLLSGDVDVPPSYDAVFEAD